jgi:hypothetical protein
MRDRDERLGYESARVRRGGGGLGSPVVTTWELWRQDDHGNEFLVRAFDDRVAAESARDELIGRGHHQHYWVVPGRANDDVLEPRR